MRSVAAGVSSSVSSYLSGNSVVEMPQRPRLDSAAIEVGVEVLSPNPYHPSMSMRGKVAPVDEAVNRRWGQTQLFCGLRCAQPF